MRLEVDIPEFFEFLRDGGYSNDQKVIFLLGGVPSDFENSLMVFGPSQLRFSPA